MISNVNIASAAQQNDNIKLPVLLNDFIETDTIVVRSPGRINLIGEHTDYNNGFVLPAAIDKAAYIALTPRQDNEIHLHSVDLNDKYITVTETVNITKASWPNYILGVVDQIKQKGIAIKGFNAALTADVPIGAGLSSSAAVECATAFALNEYLNSKLDKLALVKLSQKAEHEFAGVQCGIMDQFASMFGMRNHVVKLDCRSLEYKYEPFEIDGYKIVLFDTNVKHSLASSEYNVRRSQCEAGVSMIQQYHKEIKSLRDVTLQMLDKHVLPNEKLVYQRCRYVVEEIQRLQDACTDLENNNITAFGRKMFETHNGLSSMYDVSCKELDFLVDLVKNNPAVPGARMMGGGFGGCTINLVKEDIIDELIASTTLAYEEAMHKKMSAYIVQIEDGTSVIKNIS